jgi:hypothetical protein
MTIERAELQLDDAFDYGQVYVAPSRVVSLKGLWVCGGRVAQSAVKAHPKVVAFYQQSGSTLCTNNTFVHVKEEGSSETGDAGCDGSTPKQTRKGTSPSAKVEDNQGIVDCFLGGMLHTHGFFCLSLFFLSPLSFFYSCIFCLCSIQFSSCVSPYLQEFSCSYP